MVKIHLEVWLISIPVACFLRGKCHLLELPTWSNHGFEGTNHIISQKNLCNLSFAFSLRHFKGHKNLGALDLSPHQTSASNSNYVVAPELFLKERLFLAEQNATYISPWYKWRACFVPATKKALLALWQWWWYDFTKGNFILYSRCMHLLNLYTTMHHHAATFF